MAVSIHSRKRPGSHLDFVFLQSKLCIKLCRRKWIFEFSIRGWTPSVKIVVQISALPALRCGQRSETVIVVRCFAKKSNNLLKCQSVFQVVVIWEFHSHQLMSSQQYIKTQNNVTALCVVFKYQVFCVCVCIKQTANLVIIGTKSSWSFVVNLNNIQMYLLVMYLCPK